MELSWLEGGAAPGPTRDDLAAVGVLCEHVPPEADDLEPMLDRLAEARGYVTRDEVALSPDTPGLDELLAKFAREHLHDDDEVRYVVEGAGIFDIRSKDDRWIRLEVGVGDLVVLPAGLYHRFFLTEAKRIRCIRLFKDEAGWVPHYR
ncbi:MAG: cupin domain-containing protein [Deltaproteobacteria bacterium]|nr:MAG: cupin domain-containing protein [Deltaproteobacteria bacterium]